MSVRAIVALVTLAAWGSLNDVHAQSADTPQCRPDGKVITVDALGQKRTFTLSLAQQYDGRVHIDTLIEHEVPLEVDRVTTHRVGEFVQPRPIHGRQTALTGPRTVLKSPVFWL